MTSSDDQHAGDQTDDEEPSPIEQRFMEDGEPDEFDRELADLVESRERGSVLRPILMIVVIVLAGWVISDWSDELAYFFSSPEPVEVGDVADFSPKAADNPDWEPPLKHNSYVSIQGMPIRVTEGGNYEFFRLLGAEVYVQREVEDGGDDDESDLPDHDLSPGVPVDEHRQHYNGTGRLVSFAASGERVAGLKEFYGEKYNLRFCEDLSDREIEDLEEQRREIIRENWKERYREADPEERERRGLTPEPEEADVRRLLDEDPVCVDAYLVVDGERPVDQWWYVLLSVLLGAFMLYNAVKLYQWFRDWLKP